MLENNGVFLLLCFIWAGRFDSGCTDMDAGASNMSILGIFAFLSLLLSFSLNASGRTLFSLSFQSSIYLLDLFFFLAVHIERLLDAKRLHNKIKERDGLSCLESYTGLIILPSWSCMLHEIWYCSLFRHPMEKNKYKTPINHFTPPAPKVACLIIRLRPCPPEPPDLPCRN